MFSKEFPEVKSPEQLAFEMKVQSIVDDDEIDLDDLSLIEFVTSDEDSVDNENFPEILPELYFLGDTNLFNRRISYARQSSFSYLDISVNLLNSTKSTTHFIFYKSSTKEFNFILSFFLSL